MKNKITKRKDLFSAHQNTIILLGATAVVSFILFFIISSAWIGFSVDEQCVLAQKKYNQEDCAQALITKLDDETNSFRDRNQAIWALGQWGDETALETLKSYYTGNIPAREPYDEGISQYELQKAIKLLEGDTFNITKLVRKR